MLGRSSGISSRSTLAFALSVSCQTVCMFEGAWTSRPFHGDEWLFSSVLLPSYEKGDLVIGRLYEAIKNVCQAAVSNATPNRRGRARRARMVKRPFTVSLNSSLTALLHLSDNVLVFWFSFLNSIFLWDKIESTADWTVFVPCFLLSNTVCSLVISVLILHP